MECYVKLATLDDLAENDCNLSIPLYVEKVIEGQFANGGGGVDAGAECVGEESCNGAAIQRLARQVHRWID